MLSLKDRTLKHRDVYKRQEYKDKLNKLAESAGVSKAQILKDAIDTLYNAAFDEQPTEQESVSYTHLDVYKRQPWWCGRMTHTSLA